MNRTDMVKNCPEEFEEELDDILNDIEQRVNYVLERTERLADLDSALTALKNLSEDLY